MSATASDIRTGIGARLKAGRERMGMTLLQVAEKLHVDPKVLEYVEADRFDQLGAPVYVRGHIKRYSELVGENAAELLEQYSASTKPVLPDLTQLPKAAHHADPRKLVLPSLIVLIAFALIGTVWWILENVQSTPSAGPQPVPTSTEDGTTIVESGETPAAETIAPAGAASTTVSTPGGEPASSGQAATATPPASGARTASATPSTQPTSSAAPSGGTTPAPSAAAPRRLVGNPPPRAGTTAGAVSTAQISKASIKRAAAAETARARAVNVTLKFASDSWVEVYDAGGQRLFYDIGSANSSHALSGTPPLRVVLRNARGVSLTINGRAATVPASVMQDSGAQFMINRSGRIVRARPDGG